MINKVADDWIRTRVLWYRKRPLCQLRHNHFPLANDHQGNIPKNPHWSIFFKVTTIDVSQLSIIT